MKHQNILLFLFFTLSMHAQPYHFSRIDNTDGLSNNQIESIFKDSRGFMWFGTNYGLNRYDGYRVKFYKPDRTDSTSINLNGIGEIQEDFNGNLWLRSNEFYSVYEIKTERFIRNIVNVLQPLGIQFTPTLIHIDEAKNFYLYQTNVGIYKYVAKTGQLISYKQGDGVNSLSKGAITAIRTGKQCVWVLFQSGLLERYNEKTRSVDFRNDFILQNYSGSSISKNLYVDKDDCPWIYPAVGDRGLVCFDLQAARWKYFGNNPRDFFSTSDKYISNDLVRALAQDTYGNVWIATDHGGVNIYNKKSGNIRVLENDPDNPTSISQNSVISLFADNTGIMWVGTYKNGVSYYHEGMFKFDKSPLFYYRNALLENKDINNIYEDSKGLLWLGTNGSGLIRYNKYNNEFNIFRADKNKSSSISSDIVISSVEDKDGNMWFGTFMGGLNRMEGTHFRHYYPEPNNPNSLSNKSIYGLIEDDNKNLWIATLGGGVDQLDAARKNFKHYDVASTHSLSANYVLSLYSKDNENIYLCTSGGIDLLNTRTGTISSVFKDRQLINKLSALVINNAMVDRRNQLWIATDNGINVYNADLNTIKQINSDNGLPSDQVVSLVEADNGMIWAGTRNGLACVSGVLNSQTKDYDYSVISFDESDGLVSAIFNPNAVHKARDGRLYFGCTKGYSVFDPEKIRFNKQIPIPKITSLFIGNEEIVPFKEYDGCQVLKQSITHLKELELSYDQNNFSLYFSAMSYIHPMKNQYRYQLKGLDKTWNMSRNGMVNYSNLAPGSYELIIYASNNDNVWSVEPLVLEIVIKPPFWFSWWAIMIYILLILYAIWYIINFNLRKQKREFENEQRIREARQLHEMDEMKFRFFTNISHEFRTPLTLILNPAEKLLNEIKTPEERNLLSIIHRNASGLLDLVNQLLDFRKLDVHKDRLNLSVGDVVNFVKDICYSFTEMAERKSISYSFSSAVNELRIEFDPEKMRKIVSNLLSNAFKFTHDGGKVEVNIQLVQQIGDSSSMLKIVVSDSGIGIPEDEKMRIFERFYRVENAANGHQTGTGVGLHIVSEYVRLHEGTIHVDSQPGKGSAFIVLLPVRKLINEEIILHQENLSAVALETKLKEEATVIDTAEQKLPLMLVVDDNEDFRNFIEAIFTTSYRILKAENGRQALNITLDKIPDIIISDVMMPVMDGYELCVALKKDIRVSHIPVILLTAKTGDENKYKGLELGAEDYVSKPFNMEMLQLKVAKIIERQKKQQGQMKKIAINPSQVEITSMDEKFIAKAVALIEQNIENPDFLVEDLCREMGMSRVYFYKKVLALTDKTPSELIRYIRLKRAAELLEKSQLFINEVAYKVGFNDPKYFRKYFKDEFGINPNEYKKKFEK